MARGARGLRTIMGMAILIALSACSGDDDPAAVLAALDDDLACIGDPVVRESSAACQTTMGTVAVSILDADPGFFLAMSLDNGEAGRIVWQADKGRVITAATNAAAVEIANELGGDIVTQRYFDREFLGR